MATIDKLDMSVYSMYALRITMIEQINNQLRLSEATTIHPQVQSVHLYPTLTEMDLLLGVVPLATPWAFFYPPRHFYNLRRNPFSFYRLAPSFGDLASQEKDEQQLAQIPTQTPEEEQEKQIIGSCLAQMDKINSMISFIIGRVGQFLQG